MILNPHRGVRESRSNKSEIKPVSRDLLPAGHYLYKTGALSLTIVGYLSPTDVKPLFYFIPTEKKLLHCRCFSQKYTQLNEITQLFFLRTITNGIKRSALAFLLGTKSTEESSRREWNL